MVRLHDDELDIGPELVHRLVATSTPQYAHLPVTPLGESGSSNALFRLGDELVARLPRQPGGSASIRKEARWLPQVAPYLAVAVPEVVALGEPGHRYPEKWSITRWLEGDVPNPPLDAATSGALAIDLCAVVEQLRAAPVPESAHDDPALTWYRGGPLRDLDDDVRESAQACRSLPWLDVDLDAVLGVWDRALEAEAEAGAGAAVDVSWLHGDLLAENVLVRQGHLSAVLDFGGLALGDPTVDLIVAWEMLDAAGRDVFRRALRLDDATWARSKGWALLIALITFPYYGTSMPVRCAARRRMLEQVLADPNA